MIEFDEYLLRPDACLEITLRMMTVAVKEVSGHIDTTGGTDGLSAQILSHHPGGYHVPSDDRLAALRTFVSGLRPSL